MDLTADQRQDTLPNSLVDTSSEPENYTWHISRNTVDKLGVKMYDKVSAVVAELVANSYDADAENVTIQLPLGSELARKDATGVVVDKGFVIQITDDGHGMTPTEAQLFYLWVGLDRRKNPKQGAKSRKKQRPVMGRKGIGKLAPFGVCRQIEVWSAGGERSDQGYRVAHFFLNYDDITGAPDDKEAPVKPGIEDKTYSPTSGTRITLRQFLSKRVPDQETFCRQLAARFAGDVSDFHIRINDTLSPSNSPIVISASDIPIQDFTVIDLSSRPVRLSDGTNLPVSGWVAMAKESYKNEELAGVRIFARNKIVATTRDFEQHSGFTGEFSIRSYLVGQITAEWLDLDEGDDLVRSDRQGIIWDSEYGEAFKKWGAELIKEVGRLSEAPRREASKKKFIEKARFKEKAEARYKDPEVVKAAMDLAGQIGAFAAEDELDAAGTEYVDGLAEIVLTVAPHKALIDAFREFSKIANQGDATIESLLDLFGKTRIAEMASYSRIAAERVQAIRNLEQLINGGANNEADFQRLIADAPWLIEPSWSVISKNQSLKHFAATFVQYFLKTYGENLNVNIDYSNKRPDFTLVSTSDMLHIIEIKDREHAFDDHDCQRLANYLEAFEDFFNNHPIIKERLPNKWRIDLIADDMNIKIPSHRQTIKRARENGRLSVLKWSEFLGNAKMAHEQFLEASEQAQKALSEIKRRNTN